MDQAEAFVRAGLRGDTVAEEPDDPGAADRPVRPRHVVGGARLSETAFRERGHRPA